MGKVAVLAFLAVACACAPAAVLNITNGAPGAGHLDIGVDDFGSYGDYGGAIYDDLFEPSGGASRYETSFTAGAMVFLSGGAGGTSANLLSAIPNWLTDLGGGSAGTRPLSLVIDSPNTLNGASQVNSTFHIQDGPGARRLAFALNQKIGPAINGVTSLKQTFVITNTGTEAVDINFHVRQDADLLWDGMFDSDLVGASLGQTYLFQQEPGAPGQSVALGVGLCNTTNRSFYFAGKQGFSPPNGPPDYGYGTDVIEWAAFGAPTTWRNNVAYVGYNLDGNSGANFGDAFLGEEFQQSLTPTQSITVIVTRVYGTTTPVDTVLPSSFTIGPGIVLSGGLSDLFAADNSKLITRPGVVISSTQAPVQLTINGTSPNLTPSEVALIIKSSANQANIQQKVEMFNYVTNALEQVDARVLPLADITIKLCFDTNATRFVNPGTGAVQVKLSCKTVGPILSYPWQYRLDQVNWMTSKY